MDDSGIVPLTCIPAIRGSHVFTKRGMDALDLSLLLMSIMVDILSYEKYTYF